MKKLITNPKDLKEVMRDTGHSIKQYLYVKDIANLFDVKNIKVKQKNKD